MWSARIRKPDLTVSDPIAFNVATLVENFNTPDTLQLTGRLEKLRVGMQPGWGIYVVDELGSFRFSGYASTLTRQADGTGTAVYTSDLGSLWQRICYPVPSADWSLQSSAYDTQTGFMETRMLNYIKRNAGSTAQDVRKIARLRTPASAGRGDTGETNMRFQNLGSWLTLAAEKAALRVRVVQTFDGSGPWLDVEITDAPDLTATARFGTASASGPGLLGEDSQYTLGIPTATTVLSAAGGEGTARQLDEDNDTTAETRWSRRIESFLDQRSSTSADDIANGIADALATGVGQSDITASIVNSELGVGSDIPVGAKVTGVIDGIVLTERIRQVTTVLSNTSGERTVKVTGTFGSPDAGLKATPKQLAQAFRRIANLERAL